MPSVYKIIKKKYQLKQLIRHCKATGYASIDFETSGHPYYNPLGYPTILGVSFQPGSAWVLPLGHFDSPFLKDRGKDEDQPWYKMLQMFSKGVLEDTNIVKVAWNAKFEYLWFKRLNCKIKGRFFDGMLAKYLLDEERPMSLKPMVDKFIPEFAGYSEDYEGSKLPWDEKPLEGLSKYCALDCDLTLRLMLFFEKALISNNLYFLFRNMLMMATYVLGDSEFEGVDIDKPYLESLLIKYENLISESDKKLRDNKKIRKFESWQQEQRIEKLINKVELEIEELEEEINSLKDAKAIARKEKSIRDRQSKIDRYIAKELNTKSELKVLEPINFNAPAQMADLFFNSEKGFRFKVVKYTTDKFKNETDNASTDESVLLELAKKDKSGFCQELLNYRGLTKMYSTFIKGIHEKLSHDSKVHSSFNLHQTVTGRLSSNEPNLQQIPRDTTASDIKKMFIPPKGYLLLQLDYSQAELRVMAAQAGEKTMIKWFKEGKDIHLASALKKYGMEDQYDRIAKVLDLEDDNDPDFKIWKVRRKQAKTINFGIIYGQGASKLAESLECSMDEAKQFLKDFDKTFPKVAAFVKQQHRLVHEQAYVTNVFGRKRRLWDIDSDVPGKVAQAERQSVNAPIQGAASDYTLFSSVLIWEKSLWNKGIKIEKLTKDQLISYCNDPDIIPIDLPQAYTVHDSLGFWVKPEVVHNVVPKLLKICENPETMEWFGFQIDDVTMKVDFEVSHTSWGELKKYDANIDYVSLLAS